MHVLLYTPVRAVTMNESLQKRELKKLEKELTSLKI